MTFIAQEQGVETGSPVELYEISYDAQTWYYTSGDASFTDPATLRVYNPLELGRSAIEFSNDFGKTGIELEVRRDAPFLDLFRIAPPSGVVSVTIKRVHRTDSDSQIAVLWKGRILNVNWGPSTATVLCESIRASVQRYGLRRCFQLQCPHVLYSNACGVSRAAFEVIGQVTSMSGSIVTTNTTDGYPDNHFAGGYLEWINDDLAANERRMISSSSSGDGALTLVGAPVGLTIGATVRAYPGCDHTLGEGGCQKFANVPNYGGFPYTPTKNPFTGDLIY